MNVPALNQETVTTIIMLLLAAKHVVLLFRTRQMPTASMVTEELAAPTWHLSCVISLLDTVVKHVRLISPQAKLFTIYRTPQMSRKIFLKLSPLLKVSVLFPNQRFFQDYKYGIDSFQAFDISCFQCFTSYFVLHSHSQSKFSNIFHRLLFFNKNVWSL